MTIQSDKGIDYSDKLPVGWQVYSDPTELMDLANASLHSKQSGYGMIVMSNA